MFVTLENLNTKIFAEMLSMSERDFHNFVEMAPHQYHIKSLIQNNKIRKIEIPFFPLKKAQKIIAQKILYNLPVNPQIYGGPGTSIIDVAKNHTKKPVIIWIDIKDFFPSVRGQSIRKIFRRRGANVEVADSLVRLTTYMKHLPHGSATSPCIGRLVLNPVAVNLGKLLKNIHPKASFSIYVDDLAISGPEGIQRAIPSVRNIIERFGFRVNSEKIKVMRQNEEQELLNIKVNNRIEPTLAYLTKLSLIKDIYPSRHPKVRGMQAFIDFLFKAETKQT